AAVGDHPRHCGSGIAEITEMARRDGTGRDASRHTVDGIEGFVVDAVDAQGAFLHDAGVLIELAGAVGASPGTQLATDEELLVDEDDAVLCPLVGGAGGTDGDAGGLGAMEARAREMDGSSARALAGLETMHAVEPHACRVSTVGVEIGERRGDAAGVP